MRNPNFDPALFDAELEYKAANTTCTMCGKQFTFLDSQEGFGFNYTCGHGTKFEDRHIKIDLCCECFDEVMDFVIPMCMENPIISTEAHYVGELTHESEDRLIRLEKVLNKEKANEIARQLKKSTDRSSKLSEIERNLRKEGFDIDSIPMDRDQPWKESRESYLKEQEMKEENDHE